MSYRLTNLNNAQKTLSMNNQAWYGLLGLAEDCGWNPMGTVQPEWWLEAGSAVVGYPVEDRSPWHGSYTERKAGLVLLDDALNLADALERAWMDYEPERDFEFTLSLLAEWMRPMFLMKPGIGLIDEMIEFCRLGAFSIDHC